MKILYLLVLGLFLFLQAASGLGPCNLLNGVCRHTLCHSLEKYVGRCHHGLRNCCVDDYVLKYKM
uniref:Antimicrobial-peptide n=1 Tax=Alligator sinensis TaxID=38654 RepID=A0A2H4ZLE5_ALLSI|nr:antimicrobial-peptide [Alligator sinensis]